MTVSNGNFIDEEGNVVNIVQLLRNGEATPIVGDDGHYMRAHTGWYTDENGVPVNLITLLGSGVSGKVTGISLNGGTVVEPDENGVLRITISGDGSTVIDSALSDSSTNPVQNKVDKARLDSVDGTVAGIDGRLATAETALTGKANTADVNTALSAKANTADMNTALASKANASDVQTALAGKASTEVAT